MFTLFNTLDLSVFLCKALVPQKLGKILKKIGSVRFLGRSSFSIEFALLQVIIILKDIECSSNLVLICFSMNKKVVHISVGAPVSRYFAITCYIMCHNFSMLHFLLLLLFFLKII